MKYWELLKPNDLQNELAYWSSSHEGVLSNFGMVNNMVFLKTSLESTANIQVNFFNSLTDTSVGYYSLMPYRNSYNMFVVNLVPDDSVNSQPLIFMNLLDDLRDIDVLVEGAKISSRIVETSSFQGNKFQIYFQNKKLYIDLSSSEKRHEIFMDSSTRMF